MAYASQQPELIHVKRFEAYVLNYIFYFLRKKEDTLSLSLVTWKKYQFSSSTPIHCNGNIHKNTYCKYGIGSCCEDCSQGFGDTAKWYLCLDRSLEADRTLSFYPLHFSRLSLGTGCYSLHGGIRQQWGERDGGTGGLPECVWGGVNTYSTRLIKLEH